MLYEEVILFLRLSEVSPLYAHPLPCYQGDKPRDRALDMMMAGRLEADAEEELFKVNLHIFFWSIFILPTYLLLVCESMCCVWITQIVMYTEHVLESNEHARAFASLFSSSPFDHGLSVLYNVKYITACTVDVIVSVPTHSLSILHVLIVQTTIFQLAFTSKRCSGKKKREENTMDVFCVEERYWPALHAWNIRKPAFYCQVQ